MTWRPRDRAAAAGTRRCGAAGYPLKGPRLRCQTINRVDGVARSQDVDLEVGQKANVRITY